MESQVTQVDKKETVEVLGLDGKNQSTSSLAGVFDTIIKGKEEGKSAKESIKEHQAVEKKPSVQKTEEVKTEEVKETAAKTETEEKPKPEKQKTDLGEALTKGQEKKSSDSSSDEVTDADLKVLPTDKPKTAKRIQTLLKKIDEVNSEVTKTKQEAQEKASKLAELEKKLTETKTVDPKVEEERKKQLDELAMYRRRYELDKDPELKTKFDSRIESAETSIISTLKSNRAPEWLTKAIESAGGWNAFASSSKTFSLQGEDGTEAVTASELADRVLKALPLTDRNAVQAAMMEQIQTSREKDRFLKEEQAKANEYFSKREESEKQARQQSEKQVEEAKKTLTEWRSKFEAEEFLKDKTPAANATEAEKEQAKEWNEFNKQLRKEMDKALGANDVKSMLDVIENSVRYHAERRNVGTLQKENEKLKAALAEKDKEILKIKSAGRSIPRGGSIATTQTQPARESKPVSLEDAFDAIGRKKMEAFDE